MAMVRLVGPGNASALACARGRRTSQRMMEQVLPSWFKPNMSVCEAQHLLKGCADGCFVVRESSSTPGTFTLTQAVQGGIVHYRLKEENDEVFVASNRRFLTIEDLVAHHAKSADGLRCPLQLILRQRAETAEKRPRPHLLARCNSIDISG